MERTLCRHVHVRFLNRRRPIGQNFEQSLSDPAEDRVKTGIIETPDVETDLPACFRLQTSDLHAIDGTTGSRGIPICRTREIILATWASSELDGQAFTFELSSIWSPVRGWKGGIGAGDGGTYEKL